MNTDMTQADACHSSKVTELYASSDAKKDAIRQMLSDSPELLLGQIADALNVTELEVVAQLPEDQCVLLPLDQKDNLLNELPSWGPMTTIVSVCGSIFEFKGSFPKVKYAQGYYNLRTKGEGLHGHLLLDDISAIALLSRPFRGQESHAVNFFSAKGTLIFKIYLGRDNKRVLLPEQVRRFKALRRSQQV